MSLKLHLIGEIKKDVSEILAHTEPIHICPAVSGAIETLHTRLTRVRELQLTHVKLHTADIR